MNLKDFDFASVLVAVTIGFMLVLTGYYLSSPVVYVEHLEYSQNLNVCFKDSQTKDSYEFWDNQKKQLLTDVEKITVN